MNVTRTVLPSCDSSVPACHLDLIGGRASGLRVLVAVRGLKVRLEGWMGALAQEIEPFGIRTTIVNPGFFRTELIRLVRPCGRNSRSTTTPNAAPPATMVEGPRRPANRGPSQARSGIAHHCRQDPAAAFHCRADAIGLAERKIAELQEQIDAYPDLSASLDMDDIETS